MAFEIERKFLVSGAAWQRLATGRARVRQAYLPSEAGLSLRVRVKNDDYATLTIKSGESQLRRLEFEYPIPTADAAALMDLRQGSVIEKERHTIPWQGLMWEIDVFSGDNAGLVIAEIELRHEHQHFALPRWLGEEITGQPRYYNRSLAQHPFRSWDEPRPSRTIRI
jgi:adenylate cyclase